MNTRSNPTLEWHGFSPTGYTLDSPKVWELPLKEVKGSDSEPIAVTLGEVYQRLDGHKITQIRDLPLVPMTVKTEREEVVLDGPPFNRQILSVLLTLRGEGIDAFEALWFWYDSDSSTEDPVETYAFFLVRDNIVKEVVSFTDCPDSGFDPRLFTPNLVRTSPLTGRPPWRNSPYWKTQTSHFGTAGFTNKHAQAN